jgi:hypothetical protein
MLIKGMSQRNDVWYWVDHEVLSRSEELLFALPRTDWADWDRDGELVFARDGKLFVSTETTFLDFRPRAIKP